MSLKNLRKQAEGFTIIEVLIVLAIAGLILLIVFLAVPALQRNSRNTAIRNDAAGVLGAVSDFKNNNNGSTPTAVAVSGNTVTFSASGMSSSEAHVRTGTTVSISTAFPTATGAISIAFNRGCNGNAVITKNRAVAALYLVESTSSTNAQQCTES